MKKFLLTLAALGLLTFGASVATAQEAKEGKKKKKASAEQTASSGASTAKPKTLIHVVTVSWKPGTTPDQINAALEGAHKLTQSFPGILRVWTKTVKAQGERTHAIVMEFKDEQALKDYAGSAAQKEWYAVYEGIRDRSTTFDITN